jgi:hypothetical protein
MTKFKANEKKEAGRQRKLAAEEAKKLQKSMQKEEEISKEWTKGARDTTRADAREKEKLDKINKKLERKQLEAAENAELAKYKQKSAPTRQALLNEGVVKICIAEELEASSSSEEYGASNVNDALTLLEASSTSKKVSLERHPERRVKSAFSGFEKEELPRLKEQHPELRHSQLRQLLQKRWKKSESNPFNQAFIPHNTTPQEENVLQKQKTSNELARLKM